MEPHPPLKELVDNVYIIGASQEAEADFKNISIIPEVIELIDPEKLTRKSLDRATTFFGRATMSDAQIAKFLTHRRAWKRCIKSNFTRVLVIDRDARVEDLSELPDSDIHFLIQPFGSYGYIITNETCRLLFNRTTEISFGIDFTMRWLGVTLDLDITSESALTLYRTSEEKVFPKLTGEIASVLPIGEFTAYDYTHLPLLSSLGITIHPIFLVWVVLAVVYPFIPWLTIKLALFTVGVIFFLVESLYSQDFKSVGVWALTGILLSLPGFLLLLGRKVFLKIAFKK